MYYTKGSRQRDPHPSGVIPTDTMIGRDRHVKGPLVKNKSVPVKIFNNFKSMSNPQCVLRPPLVSGKRSINFSQTRLDDFISSDFLSWPSEGLDGSTLLESSGKANNTAFALQGECINRFPAIPTPYLSQSVVLCTEISGFTQWCCPHKIEPIKCWQSQVSQSKWKWHLTVESP